LKNRVIGGAAAKELFPGWLAVIEHAPAVTNITSVPEIVQTTGVFEVKLTGSSELAVALTEKDWDAKVALLSIAKLMVCGFLTEKLSVTGAATAYTAFPFWVAVIEQVPVLTRVTVVPDTVHTALVFDVKLTGSPEVAVPLIENGGVPNVSLPSGPNVIV
jgi:hypothetical protein